MRATKKAEIFFTSVLLFLSSFHPKAAVLMRTKEIKLFAPFAAPVAAVDDLVLDAITACLSLRL